MTIAKQTVIASLVLFLLSFTQHEKYPIPKKTDKLLFYIQRNHNSNTIIYDAIYDSKGYLVVDKPIEVYWRRYDEQGQRMELRSVEKWYAYGVNWEQTDKKHTFKIELVANKDKEFWLKQVAPFKAKIITNINGKPSILDHMYIYADNSGVWPTVKYIELFGKSTKTKEETYEKLIVD